MNGWLNYDDVVSQLTAGGLILDRDLNPNNHWQTWRVEGEDRERRGRSLLKEWISRSGAVYLVGLFGVWHGNHFDEIKLQPPQRDQESALSDDEIKAMAAARRALVKEAEEAGKRQAAKAARWSSQLWAHCQPAKEHAYLAKKGVAPHNARILEAVDGLALPDMDEANTGRVSRAVGALVIPMHDAGGSIKGLQLIAPNGGKTFWPSGMAMGSTFGVLGPFPRSGILLLTEGWATAASLHEATGLPSAYAFSANNLTKAARQIRKAAPQLKLLICADDDYLTPGNPGITAARDAAALVTHAAWIAPDFRAEDGTDRREGRKLTDFNDLATLAGTTLPLAAQINGKLDAVGWRAGGSLSAGGLPRGDGAGEVPPIPSLLDIDTAVRRFWNTYGFGGKLLFDEVERRLVHKDDVLNILPPRAWDRLKEHPNWRTVRDTEVGFDPTEADPGIRCNLFGGWPTVPKAGKCEALLNLLEYLCSNELNTIEVYQWVLKWLAYPIQHPGAKMHTALVFHGYQGTGKNRFFEAYGKIFGDYFRVLGQEAIEDKFNSDWAEKKLFILADEVLARQDMFHVKNRLKGFITGDTIRVNPKNLAAHNERNHMNIVFLSNERQPLVIEEDDRRHVVIWVPPKLSTEYFAEVSQEIDDGGTAALHHYLLHLDLGDFKPWTPPPKTAAKADLLHLGQSSEQRFLEEWITLELQAPDGQPLPFCPCLGSHLYSVYACWCERQGERKRPAKDLISCAGKRHGWRAGESIPTRASLDEQAPNKNRKMVIPSAADLARAQRLPDPDGQFTVPRGPAQTQADWLTACYFHFAFAAGLET